MPKVHRITAESKGVTEVSKEFEDIGHDVG